MKLTYFFIMIIFLSFELNAQGLIVGTYHSDGSITDNNGKVIRKSYADRYQEALDKFNNGEEIEKPEIEVPSDLIFDENGKQNV